MTLVAYAAHWRSVVLRKAYAAGFYAMGAPGFGPRATIALPTASIAGLYSAAATYL